MRDLLSVSARADTPEVGMSRRSMLELLGASIALAGLSGCIEQPREKILPYVRNPPELRPGVPRLYATSFVLDGFASGVLAVSREGRPTKIEGNPEHPMSLGAAGRWEQASVLGLYDPARARTLTMGSVPSTWRMFVEQVLNAPAGEGLWVVMPPQSSPLLGSLIERVRERVPGARFVFHTPFSRRSIYGASRRMFGDALEMRYRFDQARVVLSLGADFLSGMPGSLRWARDFSAARRVRSPEQEMNRLYVVEPSLSPTGMLADHRLAVGPADLPRVAGALLAELVRQGAQLALPAAALEQLQGAADPDRRSWLQVVARDLLRQRERALVLAGPHASEITHVIVHLINGALGGLGTTFTLGRPALLEPEGTDLNELVAGIRSGAVQRLLVVDSNPVYHAPAELDLARWIREVPVSAHLGLHRNETSALCKWFVPGLHYLESWGDARAYDGTVSLIQPLVRPLFGGHSVIEVMSALAGAEAASDHDVLMQALQQGGGNAREHLHRGFVANSAHPEVTPALRVEAAELALRTGFPPPPPEGLQLHLAPSHQVYDGRFGNNAWLQELPHPVTKQTWGNAALIGPAEAARLQVTNGQVVKLALGERNVEAPVLVVPGQAAGCVTLAAGYGRSGSESLAASVGVNAFRLAAASAPGLVLEPTPQRIELAITQEHQRMEGRDIALHRSLAEYRQDPDFTRDHKGTVPSLLPTREAHGVQWAMTIDTSICSGCGGCVVACQAENNVPVVGAEGVRRSREMHWLRIDLYHVGDAEQPRSINQPMLCQHCEKAPCEYVCPVNATVHSPSGLNEMVYNRCVGTRFCSNNCPYKVRRFNYLQYNGDLGTTALQRNPDVTVRARGVMEKCTYCVQRIERATIQARMEDRELRPGEVKTACQQACAAQAIQFGALQHTETPMVQWRHEPRVYSVLHEFGTLPRTQYLAKIYNPNPEMPA